MFIESVMNAEVEQLAGKRSERKHGARGGTVGALSPASASLTGSAYPSHPCGCGARPTTAMANVKNRLAKVTDEGFSYSARGDLTDTYQYSPHAGSTYAHLSASYWANGGLNVLSSNLTGLPGLTFGADGEGRVSAITAATGQSPVTTTACNAASEVTGVTYGSGDSDSFGFDPNTLWPTSYSVNANGVTQTGTMTTSANGNVQKLAVVDNIHPAGTQTCQYAYDDLNRLVTDNCGTAWGAAYTIGPLGNTTKGTIAGSPGTTFAPTYNTKNHFRNAAQRDAILRRQWKPDIRRLS